MHLSVILLYTAISVANGAPMDANAGEVPSAAKMSSAAPPAVSSDLQASPKEAHLLTDPKEAHSDAAEGGPTRRLLMPGSGPESHSTLGMVSEFIGGAEAELGDVTTFIGKAIDVVGDGFDGVLALGHLAGSAANGVSNLLSLIRGGYSSLLLSPGMKAYSKSLARVSAEAKARHIDTARLDRLSAKLNDRIAYAEKHKTVSVA